MCIPFGTTFLWYQGQGHLSSQSSNFKVTFFTTKFNIDHNFLMLSDKALIFLMCIPCGKIFLWYQGQAYLSRSGSNIKGTFRKWSLHGHYCFAIASCFKLNLFCHQQILSIGFSRNLCCLTMG